jgi:uncharacterized delta-60 repeat protein
VSPRLTRVITAVILFVTTVMLSQSSVAQASVPAPFDTSFGINGLVKTSIPPQQSNTFASRIITDSTERLYTAINIHGGSGSQVSVVRTSADGVLDTTYGTQGRSVSVALFQPSLAVQADNKVVLAGFTNIDGRTQLQVRRYRTNGTLDTTFAKDGLYALNSFPGIEFSGSQISIAIDNDNDRIILGTLQSDYQIQNTRFIFIALTSRGTTDFGWNNGVPRVVTPRATPASAWSFFYDMTILTDGSIVALGSAFNSNNTHAIVLVKITAGGFLDFDFDGPSITGNPGNGVVIVPFASETSADLSAISMLSDGSFVLAGRAGTYYYGPHYYAIAKFTSAGIPDASFGTAGFLLTPTEFDVINNAVSSVFSETNGSFIFPIKVGASNGFMRVLSDGTIDATNVCALCLHSDSNFNAYSLLLQSTGKIVLVGELNNTFQAFAVRLNNTGTVDQTFQKNALVINELLWSNYVVHVAPQVDGSSIVVAQASLDNGYGGQGQNYEGRPVLFRILPNGTIDQTFGAGGYFFIYPSPDRTWLMSAPPITQPDGKIVFVSHEQAYDWQIPAKVALTRILPSGELDQTFGTNGTVVTGDAQANLQPMSLAIGTDGKIFVSADRRDGATEENLIYRYTNTGTLDLTINSPFPDVVGLRIYPANDKFMLSGNIEIAGVWHAFMGRTDSDGSLDTSFNSVGYRTWDSEQALSVSYFSDVLVDGNGIITTNGQASHPNVVEFFMQFNPDGSTHNQFGNAGRVEFTIFDPDTMQWAWHNKMLATNNEFISVGAIQMENWRSSYMSVASRVTSSGQMNSTFGSNGVLLPLSSDDSLLVTATRLSTDHILIGGALKEGDVMNGFIMKMSTNSTTSTTTPPTTTPAVTVPPTTTPPTIPPSPTTPAVTVPPTTTPPTIPPSPTTPPTTSASAVNTSLDISISVSRAALLKKAKLTVPRRAKVTMRVTTPRVCRVVKSTVRAVSPGRCRVSLSVAQSGKKTTTRTTSFRIR